jgi:hypothetical protein
VPRRAGETNQPLERRARKENLAPTQDRPTPTHQSAAAHLGVARHPFTSTTTDALPIGPCGAVAPGTAPKRARCRPAAGTLSRFHCHAVPAGVSDLSAVRGLLVPGKNSAVREMSGTFAIDGIHPVDHLLAVVHSPADDKDTTINLPASASPASRAFSFAIRLVRSTY